MRKVPPWLLTAISVLSVLVIAICLIPVLIDPNDYKTEIAALIKDKTSRAVAFEGDIKLSVFPWIGISTEKIKVGNQLGLEGLPFITVAKSNIKVELLPLLVRKIEISAIVLDGLAINLVKDEQGVGNWGDLVDADPASQSHAKLDDGHSARQSKLATLAINGIVIQNAQLNWNNQQTGEHWALKNIQLNVDNFRVAEPVKIDMTADIAGDAIKFPGTVKFATSLRVDESLESIAFNDSQIEWVGLQKMASGQSFTATINASDTEVNFAQQVLNTPNLKLQYGDIKLTADMSAEHIIDTPSIQGSLVIPECNLRETFKQWEIALPSMSDAKALSNFAMSSHFQANNNGVQFTNLGFVVDNSHGKGFVTMNGFSQPGFLFDLTVDMFDVDRYFPDQDKPTEANAHMAPVGTFSLSLDRLREWDAEGKLVIGNMTFNKMTMQDMRLTLIAKEGVVSMEQAPN